MQSTGEVMGIDMSFQMAFLKAQVGAHNSPAASGTVFISVRDEDKWRVVPVARMLVELGLKIVATEGCARVLDAHKIPATKINKVKDGSPHIVEAILDGRVQLVINSTSGAQAIEDSHSIRRATLNRGIPYFTTVAAADAAARAMLTATERAPTTLSIQEYYAQPMHKLGID